MAASSLGPRPDQQPHRDRGAVGFQARLLAHCRDLGPGLQSWGEGLASLLLLLPPLRAPSPGARGRWGREPGRGGGAGDMGDRLRARRAHHPTASTESKPASREHQAKKGTFGNRLSQKLSVRARPNGSAPAEEDARSQSRRTPPNISTAKDRDHPNGVVVASMRGSTQPLSACCAIRPACFQTTGSRLSSPVAGER